MKSLLLFIVLFLSGACGYAQTYATVLADTLKIYESPTTDAAVICTRGKGATVKVIYTDNATHFSYINGCLDGRSGYVPAYQLSERAPRPASFSESATRYAPAPFSGRATRTRPASAYNENAAYICNGRYAKKYHSRSNCRGLNACKSSISKTSVSNARTMYSPCIICH